MIAAKYLHPAAGRVETGIGAGTLPTKVTQWVENPTGGRDRGPGALVRAWLEVLLRPRRFFRTGVAPGDQAPGVVFVGCVVFVFVATRFALVPDSYPVVAGQRVASVVLILVVAVAFVAPLVLHLLAAVQTLALAPLVRERAGVSETVQILAYATAPCALAGLPIPTLRAACALYGTVLLVIGTAEVHDVDFVRAAVVAALPAVFAFGYAFGGFGAAASVLAFG